MAGAKYQRRSDGVYQILQGRTARGHAAEIGHLLAALAAVALASAVIAAYPLVSLLLVASAVLYGVAFAVWRRAHRPAPPIALRTATRVHLLRSAARSPRA
jgi:hypothetical protein